MYMIYQICILFLISFQVSIRQQVTSHHLINQDNNHHRLPKEDMRNIHMLDIRPLLTLDMRHILMLAMHPIQGMVHHRCNSNSNNSL